LAGTEEIKTMKKEVTEVIKSFEDAAKATGRPNTPDFSNVPEDLREYFKANYQIIVITEALNEGWKPNWDNDDEPKYVPRFWKDEEDVSSGFVFDYAFYGYSDSLAGYCLRLCFKSEELATYAGKQFIDIWNKVLGLAMVKHSIFHNNK
jgi:hypothetical protein